MSRECQPDPQFVVIRYRHWDVATRQVLMSMKDVSSIAADVSGRDPSNAVEVLRVPEHVAPSPGARSAK